MTVPENASPGRSGPAAPAPSRHSPNQGEPISARSPHVPPTPDALQGGGMGWRDANRLPALFTEALRKCSWAGWASPAQRQRFYLLQLNDKRAAAARLLRSS